MRIIEEYDVKIFTDNIEENALDQIKELLSIDVFSDKKVVLSLKNQKLAIIV